MASTQQPDAYKSGELRRIYPADIVISRSNYAADVIVVCVPELRLANAAQEKYSWFTTLAAATDKTCQLLVFTYAWQKAGPSVWQSLAQRSGELIDCLRQGTVDKDGRQCPIILVGHGLGGLIVKHSLNALFERYYDPAYHRLRDAQIGVLFLGTPHTTRANRNRWLSLSLILRSCLKLPSNVLAEAEAEAVTVANIADKFEESGMNLPIVSVYESKKSPISDGLFRTQKQLLVDRELGTIGTEREIVVKSDEDHFGIAHILPDTKTFSELLALVNAANPLPPVSRPSRLDPETAHRDLTWASTHSNRGREFSPAEVTRASSDQRGDPTTAADFIELHVPVKLPCHLLKTHARNPQFVGRTSVLDSLDRALLPPSDEKQRTSAGLRSFSICGMGGIGKTQLALEYAWTRKEKYDAVFWIQADSSVKLDETFSNIAVELRLISTSDANDGVVSRNAVLEWLRKPTKIDVSDVDDSLLPADLANWLIIFDNVNDPIVLRDYTPIDGIGAILLTSRDPITKFYITPNAGTDLEPLPIEDADVLLQGLTYKSTTPEDKQAVVQIARRLGGLAIALSHIAGVIVRKDLTFAECLKSYDEEYLVTGTREMALSQASSGYQYSFTTIWALDTLSPSALCLLEVMSFLDPDTMQESLLISGKGHELLREFPHPATFVDMRTELMRASLVRRNKQQKTLTIHRVLQDVARSRMNDEQRGTIFELAIFLVASSWEEDREWSFGYQRKYWKAADTTVPHVLALKAAFILHHPEIGKESLRDWVTLLRRASTHLLERANFSTCLDLCNFANSVAGEHLQDMREEAADMFMTLSTAYSALGDRAMCLKYAQLHFEQRIAFERSIGRSPESEVSFEAMAYTALALGMIMNERFYEALALAEEGRIKHEMVQAFRDDTYWPQSAYAYIAWALIGLGREGEAEPYVLDTLKWRERHFGIDSTDSFLTGLMLQILGVIKEHQGLDDEAYLLFKRSLPLYIATQGESSFRTNQVRVKLGEHYSRLQQPESARVMFDTALLYWREQVGYRPELARTLFKKARLLETLGDDENAGNLRTDAESIFFELSPVLEDKKTFVDGQDYDKLVTIMSR